MGRRSKVNPSLGKAIIRKRFEGQRRPTDRDTELHTVDLNDGPSWTKLQSITQQGDLEEFLHTAELAGTEFTAERMNVKIVSNSQPGNAFLLSADEEERALQKHRENRDRLRVPRRPEWDETTTPSQLHRSERDRFMDWRRELARMQEEDSLLLTPFERNLEVWRQLWRVLERSHMVVQIVDARNPLLFRCPDLDSYVSEIDERKRCLLLINKADMLTDSQREAWATYFESEKIGYLFFSAKESNEVLRREREEAENNESSTEESTDKTPVDEASAFEERVRAAALDDADLRTRVLAPAELVAALQRTCPKIADEHSKNRLVIGLVGYPNVGKSSTINALVGAKRVNVGAMPGKTKHFQTIQLTDDVVLCDCPGLVFPTFATTTADMVCNGVLPIDQLREFTGPSALVARRIPRWVLEATYGIRIPVRSEEEGGDGLPSAEDLLVAYAAARGLFKPKGGPDQARAARVLLKDYVAGKLPYCVPPPDVLDPAAFNAEHYAPAAVATRSRHVVQNDSADFSVNRAASDRRPVQRAVNSVVPSRIDALDRQFFGSGSAALQGAQLRAKSHHVEQGSGFARSTPAAIAARSVVNDRGETVALNPTVTVSTSKKHRKRRPGKARSAAAATGVDDF
ncbi:P-loop containing nucleoside triphosphate hydrolase protein [Coemansia reversa NRRL 1564]|uniref:P-loop containing nucleoside triphosphate hydrolase protein n=1 Tax=Coemansia reversa (strain ATCC 12441 / NRRL 1564) TaxID=763665 RepID=A0A2G5BJI3_COERN|nr:P-loop containing nucleoside triphosphate hydrolase protein [Coemansia reversa NRRL 1564]|eukprot:PIA19159.1 P-loop containing nucleoside triphosphate hydrolase protein [Coemansia reversa NRRL 1564]